MKVVGISKQIDLILYEIKTVKTRQNIYHVINIGCRYDKNAYNKIKGIPFSFAQDDLSMTLLKHAKGFTNGATLD